MPPENTEKGPSVLSRRSFLGKFSLGLAAVAGAGILAKSFFLSNNSESPKIPTEFPTEDSIFHPKADPRLDSRRK